MSERAPDRFTRRRYRLLAAAQGPLVVRPATCRMPPGTLDDYARLDAGTPDEHDPVLLDHRQYFEFLDQLLRSLWQALGERARLLVRLRAVYVEPLPPSLLDDRVVLGSGLDGELAFWSTRRDRPVVALSDRIRRDLAQPGDNTLSCTVLGEHHVPAVDRALVRPWPRHAVCLERDDERSAQTQKRTASA